MKNKSISEKQSFFVSFNHSLARFFGIVSMYMSIVTVHVVMEINNQINTGNWHMRPYVQNVAHGNLAFATGIFLITSGPRICFSI